MTTAYRAIGVAAIFVVLAVAGAFVTDALVVGEGTEGSSTTVAVSAGDDDVAAPPTTAAAVAGVGVAQPVDVVPAYWVDVASNATDPLPPPQIDPETVSQGSGIQVMRPASGEPTDHPETEEQPFDLEDEPVDIEVIEAEAAGDAADEPNLEDVSPDQDVANGVPAAVFARPIQPPVRFADPCAVFAAGACPVGLPARVVVGLSQLDLDIAATVKRGEVGKMTNGTEGCPADFVEGEFNLWVVTTIPSSIEFSYHQSLPPGPTTTVSIPALGPGDPEYDRWIESQSNGEFDDNNTWTWFRTCVVLDLAPDAFYEVSPVTASEPNGQVVTFERPLSVSTVTPGETLGKPPPSFVYGDGSDLTVHVWKKSFEDGYRAFVWPIDLSDTDPVSCSDVEAELFASGGRIGRSHPDSRVRAVRHDSVPATPHSVYDSDYGFTQQFDMALREGRTYTVCVWETRLGTASYDEWEILARDQYDVVTPNSHPIAMTLVRTGVRGDSSPHQVHIYAENHDYCDPRGPVLSATVERAGEGTQMVREVFCESWGLPLEDFTFTRISVDGEVADILAIPLDPLTNCGLGTLDPGCDIRVSDYIAHTVDIPGSCDPDCAWVDLRFRVDYLPSSGGGGDTWRVGPAETFVGMEPSAVTGPDIDIFSITLDPVPDRVDQMRATFELKTPSDYTITAVAPVPMRDGDESCNSTSSGSGEGRVDIIMEGMCADTLYNLVSIVLTDAEGNTTERDLRGTVPNVWTNGYASFLRTDIAMVSIDWEQATARCIEIDDSGGFSRGADEDCWNHFSVAHWSPVTLGGAQAYPDEFPGCVKGTGYASAPFGAPPLGSNRPVSSAVVLGDLVEIDFQFGVEDSPECGSVGSSPGLFTLLEIHREEPLDSLNQDLVYTFTDAGIVWEVRVSRIDKGIANRMS